MRRIVVPRASGVLSALGLVVSERRRDLVESVLLSGSGLTREAIAAAVERLAKRGRQELGGGSPEIRAAFDLRYAGQGFELTVGAGLSPSPEQLRERFETAHRDRYGYSDADAVLELVTVRVTVAFPGTVLTFGCSATTSQEGGTRPAIFDGERLEARIHRGGVTGELAGPAIVELPEATLVVPPGWAGAEDEDGTILLERA
jgi:N-methylhydantoinase A